METATLNQFLPPDIVFEWAGSDAHPEDASFSGKNLKYILSRLPVAIWELSDASFAAMQKRKPPAAARKYVQNEKEIKIVLPYKSEPYDEESFHILYRLKEEGREFLSIDSLLFNFRTMEWSGPPEALHDLHNSVLRLAPSVPIETSTLLELCSLAAMLDFAFVADRNDFDAPFRQNGEEEPSRRYLAKIFRRIVNGAKPSRGFLLMERLGILEWFLPELARGRGLSQNRYHRFDILEHSLFTCDAVQGPNLILRLAGLFHDLGKVDTRREKPNGESSFHNHEMISVKITDRVLRRFGFESAVIRHVKFLVRNHMFHYTNEWSDRAIRRFIAKVSTEELNDLITLRLADRKGSGKHSALPRAIKEMMRHIEEVRAKEAELKVTDLAINGHTLIEMGVEAGPAMGNILKELLTLVKSGDLTNEEGTLREAVEKRLQMR